MLVQIGYFEVNLGSKKKNPRTCNSNHMDGLHSPGVLETPGRNHTRGALEGVFGVPTDLSVVDSKRVSPLRFILYR
jgi:hypothetical protein